MFLLKGHRTEVEVQNLKRKAIDDKENYEQISATLKQALIVFDLNRIEEFKNNIHAYLQQMVNRQEQVLEIWEAFLEIAGSIDPTN